MSRLRALSDQARLALMLLTRLPAGRLDAPVPPMAAARWAFPLVGLVVAPLGWLALSGALALNLGAAIAALAALAVLVLATGALHWDGLADVADGLGGGRDRDHALAIMRDSRIGSYGTLALILAVALWVAALGRLPPGAMAPALLLSAVVSRLAMLMVLDLLPPARPDGLGRSASSGGGTGKSSGRAAWVPGLLATAALSLWLGPAALAGLAAAALAALGIARLARRRIGGQTGDVLGATQVCAELACLLGLVAALD